MPSFFFLRGSSRGRAFTLIELLVVIAIISLLSAILFPVFSRARENARRSSCQTSMKYLALGIRQYVRDFDEKLPIVNVNDSPTASLPYGWADAVFPYAGAQNQFQCPSDPTPPPTADSNANGTLWDETGMCDYAYNSNISGLPEAEIPSSAATIMLSEAAPSTGRNAYGNGTGTGIIGANGGNIRHLTGANYAFADGHMKFLLPSSVYGDDASVASVAYTFANN